jgi:hypothetical protein
MASGNLIPKDSVCETTVSQGAGAYSLGGAVTACRPFGEAYADGEKFVYRTLADSEDDSYEIGIGQYVSASNTIERVRIFHSWLNGSDNGTDPIDWGAGQRIIYATLASNQAGAGPYLIDTDNMLGVENLQETRDNIGVPGLDDDNVWSGDNDFTGKVTVSGSIRLPNTLAADNYAGAVIGSTLRYRTSTGTDMEFQGALFRSAVAGLSGSFWVDGDAAHYVGEDGNEYTIPGTDNGAALNALEQSCWVEVDDFHFIEQDHVDHTDGAHSDTDPTDRLGHIDAAHSDVTHSDSHGDDHDDTHDDTHDDHNDEHSDGHGDFHSDEFGDEAPHGDRHIDSHNDDYSDHDDHGDSYTDTHTDTHGDIEFADAGHTDEPSAHSDT